MYLCILIGWRVTQVFGIFWEPMASLSMQRSETKFGADEVEAIPRCLMAAKFSSAMDPTGESTLQHWISQGQIQDQTILKRLLGVCTPPQGLSTFRTFSLYSL